MNTDKGKHYRHIYRGIKVDPYRICQIYDMGGGPREHMTKKLLRGTSKGHDEMQLLDELQCSLDRWREMIKEDRMESDIDVALNIGAGESSMISGGVIPNPGVET